jgi:hypothetical protein
MQATSVSLISGPSCATQAAGSATDRFSHVAPTQCFFPDAMDCAPADDRFRDGRVIADNMGILIVGYYTSTFLRF